MYDYVLSKKDYKFSCAFIGWLSSMRLGHMHRGFSIRKPLKSGCSARGVCDLPFKYSYRIRRRLGYVRGAMLTYAPFADDEPFLFHDYTLCGWRVASALPLPDLMPWAGDDQAPDLTIDLGRAPERLSDLTVDRPLLQVSVDGTCRFAIPGVAAYLINPTGTRVTIDPALPLNAPDIRVFLLGTVFGVLCYRRGLLPLHASCVRIGDAAVALAGPSGIGKSTLAAAFLQRGHAVLADDVTVVDIAAPAGPRVLPAFPRLKLWRDAINRMKLSVDGLERTGSTIEKYNFPVFKSFNIEPLPLAAVICLDGADNGGGGRLRGATAVERIHRHVYRRSLIALLGRTDLVLPSLLAVALAPCGIWSVNNKHNAASTERTIATIVEKSVRTG